MVSTINRIVPELIVAVKSTRDVSPISCVLVSAITISVPAFTPFEAIIIDPALKLVYPESNSVYFIWIEVHG